MKLSILLQALGRTLEGTDVEITRITDDSRSCDRGSLFVCHDAAEGYLQQALDRGAAAVIAANPLPGCYAVPDTRQAYARLCQRFFGDADKQLTLVAVTGTNGKTTVASMLHHILLLFALHKLQHYLNLKSKQSCRSSLFR